MPSGRNSRHRHAKGVLIMMDVRFPPLVPATFLERPNRFLLRAEVAGRRELVASRDPGRLSELLLPGTALRVARASGPHRRTAYTLILARQRTSWVCLVPALASRIVQFALDRGAIAELSGARVIEREVRRGKSRIDFVVDREGVRMLVEVKSAALVEDGRALFPDCPTERGTRHVEELLRARRRGGESALVFVVQRDDAVSFAPHASVDPAFARALARAARGGVRVLAYGCRVTTRGATLDRPLPVVLP